MVSDDIDWFVVLLVTGRINSFIYRLSFLIIIVYEKEGKLQTRAPIVIIIAFKQCEKHL